MHKLLKELIDKGLTLTLSKNGYTLEGFYKSGSVTFTEVDETTLECHQRYDEIDDIQSFDDIVRVNFYWWENSKGRHDGWDKPDAFWLQEFIRLDLVNIKTVTVIEPK